MPDPRETTVDAGVREAVEAHVAAINALDAEAAAAGFAADGVFTGSDDEAVGQREVYGLFRDAFAEVAAVDMELVRLVATGDTAACELVERIRWLQGAVLELRLAAFYTVIEGSITRVRVYRFFPG